MGTHRIIFFLWIAGFTCLNKVLCQTAPSPVAFKVLNVANGLPQSFVSGLVQDSTGFIWIGTRDGLARYDGRNFKYFRHIPGDSTSLSDNVIGALYLDRENRVWIYYEAGGVDILNTTTEALYHLTKDPVYMPLYAMLKGWQSFAEDSKGAFWLLNITGTGFYICNPARRTLNFYSIAALGLPVNRLASIASSGQTMVLVTDNSIVTLSEERALLKRKPYSFGAPGDVVFTWKTIPVIRRKNGDIVIHTQSDLLIYNPVNDSFIQLSLLFDKKPFNFSTIQDGDGRIYFEHNYSVYTLSPQNTLTILKPKEESPVYGFKSMLVDKSGVLWLGGNGSGIQLCDLRLPRLRGIPYQKRFHEDILRNFLHVSEAELSATSLYGDEAYYIRWTKGAGDDYWFARAGAAITEKTEVYHYANGHLTAPVWHYTDSIKTNHAQINSLTLSPSGTLWGIDFYLRPVSFDAQTRFVTVFPSLASINTSNSFTVSSLAIDKQAIFWISTALDGLFSYNLQSQRTIHFSASDSAGSLPTNQLMNIVEDPDDPNILWIGSLGGGLIKFSKSAGQCRIFTTAQGLPNNTVYSIVMDRKGVLWCSSNKGIFAFDRKTGSVSQSFTSKDGLPGDEFNRYHFFQLPDGRIAFGGVDGYTVFDPLTVSKDAFQPTVAITGLQINNAPSDFGSEASPLKQSINAVDKIVLNYRQNFLTFDFAALEYNITDKLQYRYKLEGFDRGWIYSGNNNQAVYTKLPSGHYTLKVNATNTAGEWSSHVKTLSITIAPPFWLTWWAIALIIIAVTAIAYFLFHLRVNYIRKQERQKIKFERETSDLKAQALRAQMNPHFIFNCLNSIKALIQEDKKKEAVNYLTTFSKLIRTQLNNAEQEVSLREELETCRLYAQLEALRFGAKIECSFNVDETIDTTSLKVPPLILQPFIENAIWHGILPKKSGKLSVTIRHKNNTIECTIDDDGIGREMAMRNKSQTSSTYESKGMSLVKHRLGLYNTVNTNEGSVEVIDKKDAGGNAAGTSVIITFKQEA